MNKPKQKQSREHREQIPFTDDLMFSLVMRDTEICREFLQLVLPEEGQDYRKLKKSYVIFFLHF